ncbi:MAG: OLD family endonuclease [Hapalosiphonaceae cyanobacterium JJU2]|nr:MAG: OLD family endonuclease [Hapalosiphonaceae cyanobacterium JJU2]
MKLFKFRVTNFRSVDDSGWIEVDNVTSLIGTNESGKTNLLLPLWKLNPAKDGEIKPTADYPRKRYNEIRSMDKKPVFIEAHFELPETLAKKVANLTGSTIDDVRIALVKKTFNNTYIVGFPKAEPKRSVEKDEVVNLLSQAQSDITKLTAGKSEESLKNDILNALNEAVSEVNIPDDEISREVIEKIQSILNDVNTETALKRSTIEPRFGQVIDSIDEIVSAVTKPHPQESKEAINLITQNLPVFVYYSNYGNLDSEIYLPHVIENMSRENLGNREEAKARTLKVLFEFVKLDPKEIWELGRDFPVQNGQPTDSQIKEIAEKKKERDILLQSAGTDLTQKFRAWWKQGEYRFRFQADGDHFRIWVSDDKRPEEIELEGRSTGLQWFLSFYLIFLVESLDSHAGAILLLDEPGMSLHPIAQRNLSDFFANLSQTNQLLYTTHSPFLVDPDHLDRVKAVYVDDDGTTAVSANLRAGEKNSAQTKSIYPVYAALGLSVSDTLLQGCQAVVVEGTSDQHYLSAIKNYLISKGLIKPKREILFVPAGGVKGVGAVVSLITAKDEGLPYVILDSDSSGQGMLKQLSSNLYNGATDKIIMVGDIRSLKDAEVEDLFPTVFLAKIIRKILFKGTDDDFDEIVEEDKPIIFQIQEFANKSNIKLEPGWKVELAKQAKTTIIKNKDPLKNNTNIQEVWEQLFLKIQTED